ncbi:uncharacterized protein LOC134180614 [Corticium candelabrum]|uniref:uncharacterized protein LOC134180614 n=1 Tax=Corticium candelabrum TaxID=121492 RepID=UPI002E25CB47|nr:uncharacterized protein LOC134180614 [Corticium candelabrum]
MADQFLPLTGQHSVMLRSIVFHAAESGAERVACATLYPEGHKPFSVTFSNPPTIDLTDLRMSIARGLGVSPDDVKYLDYKADDSGQCGSATFALPESIASSLHGNDFLSSLSSDGTFGNYAVNSSCMSFIPTTESSPQTGDATMTTLSLLTTAAAVSAAISLF